MKSKSQNPTATDVPLDVNPCKHNTAGCAYTGSQKNIEDLKVVSH